MSAEIEEWAAIGAKPIRSDAPSGDSARYDPAFERLQSEITKLESLSGGPVRWKEVVSLGREILEKKSKDLLVAGYLSVGLLEEQGYPGLLGGLSCIEGMISFWETLYPEAKRMRARINAIFWLAEKGGAAAGRKAPSPSEAPAVRACVEKIEALEKLFSERLGSDSPGLGDLRRAVDQRLKEMEVEGARGTEASPAATTESSSPPPTAAATLPSEVASREDAERVLEEAGVLLRRAASFVRGVDPEAPWPYRMIRALTWAGLEAAPPSNGGETQVPPPPGRLTEQFQLLVEKGEWKGLLEQAESQAQEFAFWLDPHRFSALALTRLGPSFAAAKEALSAEVRTLLLRAPALLDCRFSDGTPFAAADTRSWIEKEVLSGGGAGLSSSAAMAEKGSRLGEAREKADLLLGQGQVKEAIALYHGKIAEAPSSRDRFVLRLELARLSLQSGYPRLALSQLEALDREIARYALEEWDPPLALEVLRAFWDVLKRLKRETDGAPEWDRQTETVRARISRLDPISALEMEGKQ